MIDMASCALFELPSSAVLVLLNHIVAAANTGQLVRLAVTCKEMMHMVASADWFWQQQCEQLGWLRPGVYHPPSVTAPSACVNNQHQQPEEHQQDHCRHHQQQQQQHDDSDHPQQQETSSRPGDSAASSSDPWFRTLMKKYIPFLNIQSRLALLPGASVNQLSSVEARLEMPLPWQLWELYRFRSGQDPGQGVVFTDTCRLLGLNELHIVCITAAGNATSLAPAATHMQTEQQLTVLQQQIPGLLTLADTPCNGKSMSSGTEIASTYQEDLDGESLALSTGNSDSPAAGVAAIVFLSNTAGSVSYAVCSDGSVFILRGFTQIRVAGSLSGFLQHLLM